MQEATQKYQKLTDQFIIFKPIGYCFEETMGFDVKASFASSPVLRLIRRYNKSGGKQILRKGYSVSRDFSWIKNDKLKLLNKMLLSLPALFSVVYFDLCFLRLPQLQSVFSSRTQYSAKLRRTLNVTSDHSCSIQFHFLVWKWFSAS